jgi:maltose O-acetyltransferase
VREDDLVAVDLGYVWGNGRAVLNARWALRRADHVGTRVRLRGRPAVTNHGRMVIGDRVQLVSTIATLELVADEGGLLEICERTLVNFGCSLVATEHVHIGARCHIGPYTMMLDNDFHRVEPERRLERPPSKPIIVEDNVWIGARVIIMAGVTVGADSCIGAGAVVTSDVPKRTLVAGVPAKVIREL